MRPSELRDLYTAFDAVRQHIEQLRIIEQYEFAFEFESTRDFMIRERFEMIELAMSQARNELSKVKWELKVKSSVKEFSQ